MGRPAAAGPAAVAASDIGIAAGRTVAAVRAIALDLTRGDRADEIARELPRSERQIAVLREATNVSALSARSLSELEDLRGQWEDVAARLARWQDELRRRADALAASRDSLARMRRVWELTRDSANARQFPRALTDRVEEVLREVDRTESAVRKRLDAVLTLQSRVSDTALAVADVSDEVGRALAAAGRRLLTADQPPLWRSVAAAPADSGAVALRLRDLAAARGAAAVAFLRGRTANLAVLALVFLAVSVAVGALRRRRAAAVPIAPDLAFLIERPGSTGLLVAILLTPVLLAGGPVLAVNAIALLLLVPLARLVPGIAPAAWRRPMLGTLAATFLVLLVRVVQSHPQLERLSVLVVSALVLAGAVVARRRVPLADAAGHGMTMRAALGLGSALLAAALVLNVAGFVSLSALLLEATVLSGVAAIAFFVGARAVAGVTVAVIRLGLAQVLSAVRAHADGVERRTAALVRVAAVGGWVWVTLRGFRIADEAVMALRAVLTARLAVGTVSVSLGDVVLFGLVLWVAVLASRAIRFLLEDDVLPRFTLPRGMPGTVSTLVYYVALALGFVFAVGAVGLDLSRLALLAGAFGIGIGFGLQNIVNNFVSGLILKFERPIAVGDVIELDTMMGTAQRIGIRSSTIRTFAGAEVIVPNADLVAGRVVNWTLSDRRRRIEIPVGVAYGSDPRQVLDLLLAVAGRHPRVLADPAPSALFRGFGESSLDFELRCWTGDFDQWVQVASEVTTAVLEALRAAAIEIPFPQRDLHVRSVAPGVGASMPLREPPR